MSTTPDLHLAQFNIARLRHPMDHPATASFSELLDETNTRAEASPGFIWRHGIDSREVDVTAYDDPLMLVNASVWESFEHLRDFAFKGFHRDVYRRRAEWFTESAAVNWWIPTGTTPTLLECMARLHFYDRFGPSAYAFGTGERFGKLVIRRHELTEPVVQSMIVRLNAELLGETPEGGTNYFSLDPSQVSGDQGAFVVAWLDGEPRACGAWRRIDDDAGRPQTAEIKRMWADPQVRGARLGAAVLATLESGAMQHGITELRLETAEHLTAAYNLYLRVGFEHCPPWGDYIKAVHSCTMAKAIGPAELRARPPSNPAT